MNDADRQRLFTASCIALTVTAMTFAIRAGILTQLSETFDLNDQQLGWINAMAFLGFPVATMLGGLLYNALGAKRLIVLAFAGHLIGLALTIGASGFWTLLISSFCIGFANGSVEAGCNPLVADLYEDNKTTMLNRFHVWFPGGIVVGALASLGVTRLGFGWQTQIAIMFVPTIIYGILILRQRFPERHHIKLSTASNVVGVATPLFVFLAVCMSLSATTELGTQQWIERMLGASGASPMLIMALVTGIMAVGRFFAGPLIERLNPIGVLWASSALALTGVYLMSQVSGAMVYPCAVLFALGVTYFWPTTVGLVAEKVPESGAFGMSLIAGIGMLAVSAWNPVIGAWIDSARVAAQASATNPTEIERLAGQATLESMAIFPAVLLLLYGALYAWQRRLADFARVKPTGARRHG
ncbi:MAG: MFS transporter [Pseudomonadota bacterium]